MSSSEINKNDIVNDILYKLDIGSITTCYQNKEGQWCVNTDVKKAILDFFRLQSSVCIKSHFSYDKIPLKFAKWSQEDFIKAAIRVVPGAIVRYGSYIGRNSIIMPSFINIGSHIGEGTMIDSWATIGSGAFIGKKCHISSSVVIGGVLEPVSARPVIIEDEVFIGANSSITEGVIIKQGAVISGGVTLTSSTKIYDRVHDTFYKGFIPPYSVVVPGIVKEDEKQKSFTNSAIIVKNVDVKTRDKVSINEILRIE